MLLEVKIAMRNLIKELTVDCVVLKLACKFPPNLQLTLHLCKHKRDSQESNRKQYLEAKELNRNFQQLPSTWGIVCRPHQVPPSQTLDPIISGNLVVQLVCQSLSCVTHKMNHHHRKLKDALCGRQNSNPCYVRTQEEESNP